MYQVVRFKGHKNGDAGTNGHFNVPRNIDLQLETSRVTKLDIVQLRFYAEYQWLVDFAIYALIVYALTEVMGSRITQVEALMATIFSYTYNGDEFIRH